MKQHTTKCFGDFDYWLSEWLKSPRRASPRTRQAYTANVRRFVKSINKPFNEATIPDILDYQSSLTDQYAERSCAQMIASIRSFYKYTNNREVTTLNLSRIETAKVTMAVDHGKLLSVEEVEAMIDAAKLDPVAYLLIRVLYLTGARKSEILNLCWRDLRPQEEGGSIEIAGKGNKNRKLFLLEELWNDLQSTRGSANDADMLFPSLDEWDAWRLVKKLAKAAKINKDVNVHSFRHACASHLLEAGATLAEVRDQLGHATVGMTSHYLHASGKRSPVKLLKVR